MGYCHHCYTFSGHHETSGLMLNIYFKTIYFAYGEFPDLIHVPIRDTENLHHLHASRIILHCYVITCKILSIAFQKHNLRKLGSPDP